MADSHINKLFNSLSQFLKNVRCYLLLEHEAGLDIRDVMVCFDLVVLVLLTEYLC